MKGYFYQHMSDAIAINRSRRPGYIEKTHGKARILSHYMVGMERIFIPVALYFDRQAQPFIDAGVNIIKNDFIDMKYVPEASKETTYRHTAPSIAHKHLKTALLEYKKNGLAELRGYNYLSVCDKTAHMLELIESLEQDSQAHFAMSKHMLESIGFAALHAKTYTEQSHGRTEKLGKQLIALQLWLADSGISADKMAQKCHALGAGILVNDVPYIPFMDEFKNNTHQ